MTNIIKRNGIPLVLSTTILMGCQTSPMPIKPPKPELPSLVRNADDGVCLDREDTRDLLHYVWALEQGYE